MSMKPRDLVAGVLLAGTFALTGCGSGESSPETTVSDEAEVIAELPDPATELQLELFGQGEAIAETACAQCHSILADGGSPHADAPPFRTLHERYDVEVLAESFVEGIMVGHPDMPEFQFDAQSADSLIVYIKSLNPND
ncbi:MAG: c-type cytochrome [Hyphomonas sp.]